MSEAYVRPNKQPIDLSKTKQKLLQYEGFRAEPYKDSKGKWTIGVGTLIGDGSDEAYRKSPFYKKKITEEQAMKLMSDEMSKKLALIEDPDQIGEKFFNMSQDLQDEIISSYYRGGLSGSPNAKKLIREGKYEAAAKEFLDNDEYREAKKSGSGVAKRMEKLAAALRAEASKKPDQKLPSFQEAVEERIRVRPLM